ncbi:MAG: response regulator [Flavobacteriales bacterium]
MITTLDKSYKRNKTIISDSTYKVFIVEDNNTSQMMLENYLRKLPNCEFDKKPNLEIFSFATGKECLNAMYIKPDIIILDYYLDESNPDAENGLTILKKIKAIHPSTKVLIMSGQENVMVTAELFNKGASDYVSKEHYGVVRVGQSILRLISEIEFERRKRSRNLIYGILVFLIGVTVGWAFYVFQNL